MPRNASGNYTLPAGNPVVTGTTIASTWANTTLDDLKTEVTDSLSRSGKGGMLAPLALVNGAVGAPALTFTSELSTGLYRPGANELAAVVAGAELLRLSTTGTEPAAKLLSPLAAASVQQDVLLDTTAARTAGNLLAVRNAGSARFRIAPAGGIALGGTSALISAADSANLGLVLKGNKNAADAGTDVTTDSSVARTAGNLLDVQNAGSSKFSVAWDGVLTAAGGIVLTAVPAIVATLANSALTLRGNRSAADTGADLVVNTAVARTAGNLLSLQNNGTQLVRVDFNGNVLLESAVTYFRNGAANASLQLLGNRNAADSGADIILNSSATRTAGNLLDVQNNGTSKAYVTFAGGLGSVAAESTTTATAGTNWSLVVNSVRRNAGVVTFRFQAGATVPSATFGSIATIPAGYRPTNTIFPLGWVTDFSAGLTFVAEFQIDSAGLVQIVSYDNGTSLVAPFAIGNSDSCDLIVTYVL